MSEPRDNELLNTEGLDEQLAELAGYRSANDSGIGPIDVSEIELAGNHNPTDIYQGDTEEGPDLDERDESLDMLTSTNLREGETDDVMEAVEEGLTYVPPIDPVLSSATAGDGDSDDLDVVNGFALDADASGGTTDLATLVLRRLRRDSATIDLAEQIHVREVRRGVIELRGAIRDLTDEDMLIGVAEDVEGVEEVVSRLTLD